METTEGMGGTCCKCARVSVRYTVKRLSYYIGGRIDGSSGRKLRPVYGKINAIKKNKLLAMMKRGRRL
jgi:hypothetical protein